MSLNMNEEFDILPLPTVIPSPPSCYNILNNLLPPTIIPPFTIIQVLIVTWASKIKPLKQEQI